MAIECPDCGRGLATARPGIGACYNCNAEYEIGQCDGCGDRYPLDDLTAESAPEATLWWCRDCASPEVRR